MAQPRRGHTLTVLRSGEVLAVGGNSADDKRLLGAELYDPSRGRWKPAGSLSSSRLFHTATLLADGRVAVLGGSESSYGEIYDPRTGAWTKTSPGGQVRTFHAAALLPGGQILVTGGQQGADNAALTAEIYDPALDRFSLAGAPLPRALPAATQLKDGNILLSGGQVFGAASRTAEIYDFRRKRFQRVAEMAVPRVAHTSTLLSNGNVVVTGGSVTSLDGPMVPFVEMFEPAKGKWRMLASMSSPRAGHGATLLSLKPCGRRCGDLLVTGGALCGSCVEATMTATELFSLGSTPRAVEPKAGGGLAPIVLVAGIAGAGIVWIRRNRRSAT